MNVYLKFLRVLMVLMVGVFFLVGSCIGGVGDDCDPDPVEENLTSNGSNGSGNEENNNNQNSDGSSQDEGNDNSVVSNDREKTEYHEMYAERQLTIDVDVPFEISVSSIKGVKHAYSKFLKHKKKKLYYVPDNRYIGKDEIKVRLSDTNNLKNEILITYKINVKKPPLEENRDFVINYGCDDISNHLSTIKTFDIGIVDDDLTLLEKLYDDNTYMFDEHSIPEQSKNFVEHYIFRWNSSYEAKYFETSIHHHNTFSNHIDDNMMFTCNYSNGSFNLIYPLNKKDWYAQKPYRGYLTFSRNNLYFYTSSLSDLHSKIYLKEYKNGTSSEESYIKANNFMDKIFPNSHYTAELSENYDFKNKKWIKRYDDSKYHNIRDAFDHENKLYYEKIKLLSDEITGGDITLLLQKIADNYESYYLSGNNNCLNSTICGTFFPEYTKSVTLNKNFEEGLKFWKNRKKIIFPAKGDIEFLPKTNRVNLEFLANIPDYSNNDYSYFDFYQTEILGTANIDDYFFEFDADEIYGGASGGHPAVNGLNSSGFAGVYTCYKDKDNKSIACIAWSDHTNKFDMAWGPAENRIESSSTFYNIRLNPVIRRLRPNQKHFVTKVHLGEFTKKHLPEIYKRKDEIKSIEYGLFASEFRNQQNGCYEVNLLKIKN